MRLDEIFRQPMEGNMIMTDDQLKKAEFSIGAGIAVSLVWLTIFTCVFVSYFVLMDFTLTFFVLLLGNYGGYYYTKKILDSTTWPDKPNISNLLGKWIAIFGSGILALIIITFCLGMFYMLFPLFLIPPTLAGWVSTAILLIRRLSVRPERTLITQV